MIVYKSFFLIIIGSILSFLLITELIFKSYGSIISIKVILTFGLHFSSKYLLIENCCFCLLPGFFNTSFHPVFIIACWFQISVIEFFFNIPPYFSIFQIRIQLNNLHQLFFWRCKLV